MDKKKRNSLAGSKKGTSKSARYFQENPEARAKKNAGNKIYHSTPARKKYRASLNKANRDAGTYGQMTKMGKDRSHTKSGKLVLESSKKNRARNGKGKKPKLKP
jgi:hypothetical protein